MPVHETATRTLDQIQRLAAFADGVQGGNPAGVCLGVGDLPTAELMQSLAAEVGYSETVFSAKQPDGSWRTRYFAPTMEVPFCGHATIALGAALARAEGAGRFDLALNEASIWVEGAEAAGQWTATLQSPPTSSRAACDEELTQALALFGMTASDLDQRLTPSVANGGANHLILALQDRATLAAMDYDFEAGKALMQRFGWVTIALVVAESDQHFHARNAFAAGGVVEDPATGAAAAALAGMLRDQAWAHGGAFTISQGMDMGVPSALRVELSNKTGESVLVSGAVRVI